MRKIKNKKYLLIVVFSLSIAFGLLLTSFAATEIAYVHAISKNNVFTLEKDFSNDTREASLQAGDKKEDDVVLIEGSGTLEIKKTAQRDALKEAKYIPNANYFLLNPQHHVNDSTDNSLGVCPTVAVQLLLGYHNYYSDRRIIPSSFLASDYGNLEFDPYFERISAIGQGCDKIGTGDGVYEEIFNRTFIAEVPGIGQAIPLVVGGANSFINEYANGIANNVSLTWHLFSAEQARADIDAGKPIALGMDLLLEGNMHVVVAYGYAKLYGVNGFLVHYGWGSAGTMVWAPDYLFGYQIRMDVDHVHNLTDTGVVLKDQARQLVCSECGYKTLDALYNMNSSSITGVRYPLTEQLIVPRLINYYDKETATFDNQTLSSIGESAFANQAQVEIINLPLTITSIGANAFAGCTSLMAMYIPMNVTSIGAGAFAGCSSLISINIPTNLTSIGDGAFAGCNNMYIDISINNANYSAQGNILYNKAKTKMIGSGDIAANITIPDTVTEIAAHAFENNANLQRVDFYGAPTIGLNSFLNCNNLEKVYFYSYDVPQVEYGAFVGTEFTLYVPHSKQSAYSSEFSGFSADIDFIPIAITFVSRGEVIQTLDTYYGAQIVGIEDPFNEGYIFNYWLDGAGNTYQNGDIWDSTVDMTVEADWTAGQNYINFAGYGTADIADKLVTYDEEIGELPVPDSSGPVFIGWKDEHGVYYTEDTIWKRTSNLTLFADYEGEESGDVILYYVDLDQDGGVGGSDNLRAEYMAPMPAATAPTRLGYAFKGYYTEKNGNGVQYYSSSMASVRNWDIASDKTLYAYWEGLQYTVTFNKNGGTGGTDSVTVVYGSVMPTSGLVAPTRIGYALEGYCDSEGNFYYIGETMSSSAVWNKPASATLTAKWIKEQYSIILDFGYDSLNSVIEIGYGETVVADEDSKYLFNRVGYDFQGFYSGRNGTGTKYFDYKISQYPDWEEYCYELVSLNRPWWQDGEGILYAHWTLLEMNYVYEIVISNVDEENKSGSVSLTHGATVDITAPDIPGYIFEKMWVNGYFYETSTYRLTNVQLRRNLGYGLDGYAESKPIHLWYPSYGSYPQVNNGGIFMSYLKEDTCIAEGSLITLANGTKVPVETLTGNEMLLVWNLHTGSFDVAPILFIDHDGAATYKVINLFFSDGTQVKVIYEHAFWDFDLNKYVFIREDAAKYVGHWFNKQMTDSNGNLIWGRVQLVNVTITEEYTTAWSPVTYEHLCIYVNEMLSMPGATEGLINIFEVNGDTMQIDQEQYLADIATYGLFTYEEFAEIYPIPEEIFEAFGGEHLKVSIGKGLIDYETLGCLIERYSEFF